MSGGVDSSVAAALLCRAGHEVIGLTMRLGSHDGWEATRACCGLTELHDARRVADRLEIPHYVLDHTLEFERDVVRDFVDEYARGRTPNPCVRCNQHLKFAALLDRARAFGCSHVATGHYGRLGLDQVRGRYTLQRAADPDKDQSYVLGTMTQAQLAGVMLPLGGYTKPEVRDVARELGLATADKAESQDLCFVTAGKYADLVAQRRPEAVQPGPIVDPAGRQLGTHQGLAHYTVGQRKGLGLASEEPLYVAELRAADNTLVVAPADLAGRCAFDLAEVNWVSQAATRDAVAGRVQFRYRMAPVGARLQGSRIELNEPQRGIARGQLAVLYDGAGYVLAAGTIAQTSEPVGRAVT